MPTTSLMDSLHAVRRKVRTLTIISGTGLAVAAAIGLLVATVFLDWTLALEKLPRFMLILGALGALGYVLWHWLAQPSMAKLEIGDVAGRLEHTFPQFDDRLRSTVNFVQGTIPGSKSMQGRVISETTALAGQFDFDRVIVRRPVYIATASAAASVLLLALLVSWGGHSGWLHIAANRLFLGDQQWPKTVEIAMDGQLPDRVPVGQKIPVKLHLIKGDKDSVKAYLWYRYDNGPWNQVVMKREAGAYTALLSADLEQGKNNGNLQVKLEAGDDQQIMTPISVVPRLQIARVDADITPPTYIQPVVTSSVNLSERPATMAFGSQVGVRLAFNKPLKDGAVVEIHPVRAGQKLPAMTWDPSTGALASAHFQAGDSFRFTVKATDVDGFQNPGGEEYDLIVKEDQPPSVQIEEPRRPEDRTPTAGFDIKALAEDDYGIVGAQLMVDRVNISKSADPAQPEAGAKDPAQKAPAAGRPNHWVVDLVKEGKTANAASTWALSDSRPDLKRYGLSYHWELPTLANADLKPGDVLDFYVQVKDNFFLNGKEHDWVPSGKLSVTIISQEAWETKAQAEAEHIQQLINTERLGQLREKAESETLKAGLDRNKKFDDADKAQANRLANDQATTQAQTMQLGERLQSLVKQMNENKSPDGGLKQTAEQVSKDLKQAADSPMRDAKQNIDAAKDPATKDPSAKADEKAEDAADRSAALADATKKQDQAADMLQKSMDKLGQMGGLSEAIANIQRVRDDQEKLEKQFAQDNKDNVSKKPEELSKGDQDKNAKHAEDQKDLKRQLDQALQNMDQKADKMAKSDPTASQAMKQASQMGKQQGLSSKQEQAAQDMQQNQQASAQQNQKQVEVGLDQILNKLKEAERKRLEELARQLAQMQQLIAELIQNQAGHNMDNLLVQGGPKRLGEIESKDRDQLFTLSDRDPKAVQEILQIGQLITVQEQTENNARDIAKQAETLPDPAPSAKLTQAAGDMERAVVHLRDGKLADAYQPPQVDALATLLEAKASIDNATKQVQDKLDDQNAETIKQAYVKLLKAQKEVGQQIQKIDKATKDNNGETPRADSVKLAQLPTDQGKLIETAEKIGEELKQLDSIVYDWANKDIVKQMGEVKDGVAKPETGQPTQVADAKVEEQLQAMIDSLTERKDEKRFDQHKDGGGGAGKGGNKPKLPSEAELQLLKKNQEAVNNRTKDQDTKAEKDKEALLGLGTRQGELRNLLDQLIQKVTQGEQKLGPPPDPKDQLPEEATKEDVDNQEIQDDLLHDKVNGKTVDKGIKATGDRMARSGTRLADADPGKVTQEIQRRIIIDLDDLIQMAQQQQQQSKSKPGSGKPGDKMGPPKPGQGPPQEANGKQPGKPQPNKGNSPAQDSSLAQGGTPDVDPNADVTEKRAGWGGITPREREAVQESAGEQVIGKYKALVDDYYRSLSEKSK